MPAYLNVHTVKSPFKIVKSAPQQKQNIFLGVRYSFYLKASTSFAYMRVLKRHVTN